MKRYQVEIEELASYTNLLEAATKAGRCKRKRSDVRHFFANLDASLHRLREDILEERAPEGNYRSFYVFDPKKRQIQAASFHDRVLHHAIMNVAESIFEKGLVTMTYACRPNKGVLAAVKKVQQNIRRYPWFVKIDIQHYFDNIDHVLMFDLLKQRFKGKAFLRLLKRIITSFSVQEGKGLPIGSLTSQHFANYYLNGIDRYIAEKLPTRAYVRYMDDMIWWCDSKDIAKNTYHQVGNALKKTRLLEVKPAVQINHSKKGVSYCGCRILAGELRLSQRRKRSYSIGRKSLEDAFSAGIIDELQLQKRYAAVLASTAHTDSQQWRKENLRRQPSVDI